MLHVVNPRNHEDKKEYTVEAQSDWTIRMLLGHLAEKGVFTPPPSSSSSSAGRKKSHAHHQKASVSHHGDTALPPSNAALTSDGIVYDLKKRIEDYKSIGPSAKLYITSLPYRMATRIFIVFAETGETFVRPP